MAQNPTQQERASFLKQLEDIQKQVNSLSAAKNKPQGQVAGASYTIGSLANSDALKFGAAGRGEIYEGMSQSEIDAYNAKLQAATDAGVPMSGLGDINDSGESNFEKPKRYSPPKLSDAQALSLTKSFGLEGILDPKAFVGLTAQDANSKAIQELRKRKDQTSSLTAGAFNTETVGKTQRAVDKFNFALDDASNDPFNDKLSRQEKQKNILEVTSKEIAGLFSSPEELVSEYQNNLQLQQTLNSFIQKGGTIEDIAGKVASPVTQDGKQDTASYLASFQQRQQDEKVLEDLAPERALAQEEIARNARIPQELKEIYFGSEKQIGILQMRQEQAKESQRIIEEQERDANRTAKDRARMQTEKNNVELEVQRNKIEENRLHAKNYMTAQLAKLGALKTTGAAPQALTILEQKYQQQAQLTESQFKFANRNIEIGLDEELSDIENKTDQLILGLQEDLTNDNETVTREILKAEQAAEKVIFGIQEKYAKQYREQTAKHVALMKKEAEKYAKEFAKTASGGVNLKSVAGKLSGDDGAEEGQYVVRGKTKGVIRPDGSIAPVSLTPTQQQDVEAAKLRGLDTIRYFLSLPNAFRDTTVQEMTNRNGSLSFAELQNKYKQYQQDQAAEKEAKQTKTSTAKGREI